MIIFFPFFVSFSTSGTFLVVLGYESAESMHCSDFVFLWTLALLMLSGFVLLSVPQGRGCIVSRILSVFLKAQMSKGLA